MKHLNVRSTLSALLAALMLLGVLFGTVACAQVDDDPSDTGASTGGDAASESSESATEAPYALMEKKKYNREFAIMTREDLIDDMEIEAITGDILDDSIYARNVAVENDFGITFEYYTDSDLQSLNSKLSNQVSGGLDEYDMFIGHKFSFASCAQQNYCLNLNSIDTLDLENPWWDKNCYDNLTIDGKTYLMTGDINPSSMRISSCMVFNKDLMKDLQKDVAALNKLTVDGGWTLDVLHEYVAEVSRDLNGDGKMNYEDDQYGLTSWMMDVPFSMYYGAGKSFVNLVDGEPELSFSTEEVLNIYDKIQRVMIEDQAYFVTDSNIWSSCYDVFRAGRALFCDITLGKITTYIVNENMEDDYGILPMPKYDTAQEEYLSFVNGASAFVMLANTEKEPEFVGTILEAMSAYNYSYVTPNMFEIVTKLQAAQDLESAAMVDYIIRNRIYDLSYWYSFGISDLVLNGLKAGKTEIASDLAKAVKVANKNELPKLIKAYNKCQ